ncbi:MAG: hypothetical protein PUB18_05435 [bacterium]|nr:hypothetical protein [bacterium]
MRIRCEKANISDYGFLRLWVSTMVLQGQSLIFENHQLEKDLYQFYDNSQYYFLFEDIVKKEDKILMENSYVDLSIAFNTAYTFGLLSALQGSGRLRSIINLSEENAEYIAFQFSSKQVEAMSNLCIQLHEQNKKRLLLK